MDFNCSGKEKENKGISNVTIIHYFAICYLTDLTCTYSWIRLYQVINQSNDEGGYIDGTLEESKTLVAENKIVPILIKYRNIKKSIDNLTERSIIIEKIRNCNSMLETFFETVPQATLILTFYNAGPQLQSLVKPQMICDWVYLFVFNQYLSIQIYEYFQSNLNSLELSNEF